MIFFQSRRESRSQNSSVGWPSPLEVMKVPHFEKHRTGHVFQSQRKNVRIPSIEVALKLSLRYKHHYHNLNLLSSITTTIMSEFHPDSIRNDTDSQA